MKHKQLFTRLLTGLVLTVSSTVFAQGNVIVVDSLIGPGTHFLDINPAIQAAADGDMVLVRPGIYSAFVVDGKDIDIVGDVTATTSAKVLTGRSIIRNIPVGKEVVLSNMRLTGGLEVTDCDGGIMLQSLIFGDSYLSTLEESTVPGLDVLRSDHVSLARSTVGGYISPQNPPFGSVGPTGMRLTDSTLYAWDSIIEGGEGAAGSAVPKLTAMEGFPGIHAKNSVLHADEITVRGGRGGTGSYDPIYGCTNGATGGIALILEDVSTLAELRASDLVPGLGGYGGMGCADGPHGAKLSLQGGTVTSLLGEHRNYGIQPLIREGDKFPLTIEGSIYNPGAIAFWLASTNLQPLALEIPVGLLLDGAPTFVSVLGTTSAKGGLLAWKYVPDFGLGIQGVTVFTQAALWTAKGELLVTEAVATTILGKLL